MVIRCTLKKLITAGKYLGRARKTGKVGMKEIAEEIQRNCSATCCDVTLVSTVFLDNPQLFSYWRRSLSGWFRQFSYQSHKWLRGKFSWLQKRNNRRIFHFIKLFLFQKGFNFVAFTLNKIAKTYLMYWYVVF